MQDGNIRRSKVCQEGRPAVDLKQAVEGDWPLQVFEDAVQRPLLCLGQGVGQSLDSLLDEGMVSYARGSSLSLQGSLPAFVTLLIVTLNLLPKAFSETLYNEGLLMALFVHRHGLEVVSLTTQLCQA